MQRSCVGGQADELPTDCPGKLAHHVPSEMHMKITGACHCGAIRYEADVDPATAGLCHCTDCQTLSGTAFRVSVRAVPNTFRIVAGTPRVYVKTAESGNPREQAFC